MVEHKALALVLLAVFMWSWLGPLGKMVYALGATAYQLVAFRVLFAWAALLPWAIHKKWWRIRASSIPVLFLYSLFSVVFNYLGFYLALKYISVTAAIVILYAYPALVLLLSRAFLKEPLGGRELIALTLTLVGIFLIAQGYRLEQFALNAPGVGLALLAAFSVAIYNVGGKRLVHDLEPWALLFWGFTLGAAVLWVAYPGVGRGFPALPIAGWSLILCIALFPTLGSYGLYLVALKGMRAGHASLISTLEPLLAASWAALVLGERLEAPQAVGGALVLSAASLILWRRLRPRREK
jgi:drug/metabolite transporter (DMT)-like permease